MLFLITRIIKHACIKYAKYTLPISGPKKGDLRFDNRGRMEHLLDSPITMI